MERRERLKTVLGISLLYIIVTSIFSLISKLCSSILSQNGVGVKVRFFLQDSLIWVVVVAAVIIALTLWLKKLNQGAYFNLLGDSVVRMTAGALAILEGVIGLAGSVPAYATSIQATIQTSRMMQFNTQRMLREVIVSYVISVFVILCQIFVGIYLIKSHKDQTT